MGWKAGSFCRTRNKEQGNKYRARGGMALGVGYWPCYVSGAAEYLREHESYLNCGLLTLLPGQESLHLGPRKLFQQGCHGIPDFFSLRTELLSRQTFYDCFSVEDLVGFCEVRGDCFIVLAFLI